MTLAAQTIASQSEDLGAARRAMIDSQLRVSGINQDWLLAVLARVPREDHVPAAARGHAYIDRAIPLDGGQALPAPLVQASLLAQAEPKTHEKVLVISPAGYLSALVEPLVQSVETVSPAGAGWRPDTAGIRSGPDRRCGRSPTAHREAETAKAHRG